VLEYKHNHSAFETPKYAYHPSEYSTLICTKCGWQWRSKAKYIDDWQNPVSLLQLGECEELPTYAACCVKDAY
jgi:hypothetical protein